MKKVLFEVHLEDSYEYKSGDDAEWFKYPLFSFFSSMHNSLPPLSKPLNPTANTIAECIGVSKFDGVHMRKLLGHEMLCMCNLFSNVIQSG